MQKVSKQPSLLENPQFMDSWSFMVRALYRWLDLLKLV